MRKCSSFMCILVVLLAGYAEAVRPLPVASLVGVLAATGGVLGVDTPPGCLPFKDIYADGEELIEKMWGGAFKYETNEAAAYTMWWFEGGKPGEEDIHDNPNEAMAVALGYAVPDTCQVQYFHKDAPSPEPDNFVECHPWHANSCCHQATVVTPTALKEGYGPGYEWDRCGPLSQACERFFVMEACFYECDVTAGLYRKFTHAQHEACSGPDAVPGYYNETADYTCDPAGDGWGGLAENAWQLHEMPIKASFADAWHRACANDLFSGGVGGDYFEEANTYHAQLEAEAAAEAAAAAAAQQAELDAVSALEDEAKKAKNEIPSWGIAVIVICAGFALVFIVCVCYIYNKEKTTGEPMFTTLAPGSSTAGKAGASAA